MAITEYDERVTLTGPDGSTVEIFRDGERVEWTGYVNATIPITVLTPAAGLVQWTVGPTDLVNCPPDNYIAFIVLTTTGYEEHTRSFTLFVIAAP